MLALLAALFALLSKGAVSRDYTVATASIGGTYYPIGTAIATLVKLRLKALHDISMTAITTAGSIENVGMLARDETAFAILQGYVGREAWDGNLATSEGDPRATLRSVAGLWPNVEQFVVLVEAAPTGSIEDLITLKGRRVAFGGERSGTLASNSALLAAFGLDVSRDFELVHMGYGPAIDALQNGEVAAIGIPAGVPTKSLARLKATLGERAVILEFSAAQAERADGGRMIWRPYQIPEGTYSGQPRPVNTIAQPNFLAVRADVPDEDVYRIVEAIFSDLPFLRSLHSAVEYMSLDNAVAGLPMPLHPGALRFFRQSGVEIPQRLLEPDLTEK